MSVRFFGHFLPFPIFSARRALCSAPPCTPDAWTNGPHMVCSLCTLVPMIHTPRGRTEAPTHKELSQVECGQFCHFGTCEYNSGYRHAMAHEDVCDPSMCGPTLDFHRVPHRTLSPVSEPSWRNTLGDTFNFGSFLGMPKHPFLGPQFQPPMWSIGGPISLCPRGARTQFKVLTLDVSLRSCFLSHEPWVLPRLLQEPMRNTSILPIFCHL